MGTIKINPRNSEKSPSKVNPMIKKAQSTMGNGCVNTVFQLVSTACQTLTRRSSKS
eukprot:gene19873-39417_t